MTPNPFTERALGFVLRILCIWCIALAIPSIAVAAPEIHPLHFAFGDFATERQVPVALLVTVKLDGRDCSVQLDTGVSHAFIPHGSVLGSEPYSAEVFVELGSLRRAFPVSAEAKTLLANCTEGLAVATLGNGFFDQGSITLDLPSRSLTVEDAPILKNDASAQAFRYAKWWGGSGGLVLISVERTGALPTEAMLDTGAVRLELGVLDQGTWTALADPTAAVSEFSVQSWGQSIKCTQAPARWPLALAGQSPAKPTLTYCPAMEFKPAQPILGILGLRGFLKSRLIIDYPSMRWRVLESSPCPPAGSSPSRRSARAVGISSPVSPP